MGQVIPLTPIGQDIVLTNAELATPINLPNIPDEARMAQVYINNDNSNVGVRYFDNRTPSDTSGKILYPSGWMEFHGSMRTAKFVRDANSAGLEMIVSYFA